MTNNSKGAPIAGCGISGLLCLFLIGDAAINILAPQTLVEEQNKVGFALEASPTIGAILLICTLAYMLPRTAVLGAILLTGFLGGAICTHFRVGEVGTPPEIVSVLLGVMVWLGIALRHKLIWTALMNGTTPPRGD